MLLSKINRFLTRTGLPWSKFGRLAVNDPRFVSDLRNGRQPRPHTRKRVEHFMNIYQEAPHA